MAEGDEKDWVDLRVDAAREAAPTGEATAVALKEMMRGVMADRLLAAGDQTRLAKELLTTLAEGGE